MNTLWERLETNGKLPRLLYDVCGLDTILSLNRWVVTDGGLTVAPGEGSWTKRVIGSYCSIAYWDGCASQIIRKLETREILQTNNEAEYTALLFAINRVLAFEDEKIYQNQKDRWKDVHVFMDSKLVVNQVNGKWRVNARHLLPINNLIKRRKSLLGYTLMWVPREVIVSVLGH